MSDWNVLIVLFQLMLLKAVTSPSVLCTNQCIVGLHVKSGASEIGEGGFTYRQEKRQKDRERDLMDVGVSADRLPAERLLVAIETLGEEIKKKVGR